MLCSPAAHQPEEPSVGVCLRPKKLNPPLLPPSVPSVSPLFHPRFHCSRTRCSAPPQPASGGRFTELRSRTRIKAGCYCGSLFLTARVRGQEVGPHDRICAGPSVGANVSFHIAPERLHVPSDVLLNGRVEISTRCCLYTHPPTQSSAELQELHTTLRTLERKRQQQMSDQVEMKELRRPRND